MSAAIALSACTSDRGPRVSKQPALFQCSLCPKRFTRRYILHGHLRTHTDERPFVCTICGKAFARQHDRKLHEGLHSGQRKFVCKGDLEGGYSWGCGRRFALAKNLRRHFSSDKGEECIKPLLDQENSNRLRDWHEARRQARRACEEMRQKFRQNDLSIEPVGSLPTPEQHRQLPPPERNPSYHEPDESVGYPPMPWMTNQGEKLSSPQSPLPQSSITASPTTDEAVRAANILRRYLRHPDRSHWEKYSFSEYLERPFDSDTAANDFLSTNLGGQTHLDV